MREASSGELRGSLTFRLRPAAGRRRYSLLMARRSSKRPYSAAHRPLDLGRLSSVPRTQTGPGGADFTVRRLRGGAKTYTCPGCNRSIPPGTPHVVAWSNESLFGADRGLKDRRHWHTSCWERRRW